MVKPNDPRKADTVAPPPSERHIASLRSCATNLRGMASRMDTEADNDERVCRAKTKLKRATAQSLRAQAADIDAVKADWETRA